MTVDIEWEDLLPRDRTIYIRERQAFEMQQDNQMTGKQSNANRVRITVDLEADFSSDPEKLLHGMESLMVQ